AANAVESPPFTVSGCMPGPDGPGFTLIAYAYTNRTDDDIWSRDSCPSLSNGLKTAEPLVNGYGGAFAAAISP
ncbi:MAG: hypothetical protein JWL72_2265, partial [Ilumatobacteraceae bacterium]|nr:hypothetical protein [Ilumatobacteraceae bacterium]